MKYHCVTSMNREYYDHIGSVMIESWLKYWPEEIQMTLYAEKFIPKITSPKLKILDWSETCKENWDMYAKVSKGPSLKFAKKGFAFLHALENPISDFTLWLDADLLFHKIMPIEKINAILPEKKLIALFDQFYQGKNGYTEFEYADVKNRIKYGAESGFVMVNSNHKFYSQYVKNYRDLYLSDTKHELLSEWYDSEVVILAARDFLTEVEDLSKLRTTNKTQTPLNRCWLSEYVSHQKAKSKLSYNKKQLQDLCNF